MSHRLFNCRTLAAALFLGTASFAAQAVNSQASERERFERTDQVSAGIGGIGAAAAEGGGVGTITLAGVSGTVTRAYLYWHGIDIEKPPSFTGGNADYDEPQIELDGQAIVGERVFGGELLVGRECAAGGDQ